MWSIRKTSWMLAGLLLAGGSIPAAAQNNTNSTVDPGFFNYGNLTTVDIAYSVYTGCGPASNVTVVRRRVSYTILNGLAVIGDTIFGTEAELRAVIVGPGNANHTVISRNPRSHDPLLGGEDHLLAERAMSDRPPFLTPWPNAQIPYTFSTLDLSRDPNVAVSTFLTAAEIQQRKDMFRLAVQTWREKLPWLNMFEINDQNYNANSLGSPTRLTISMIPGCTSWSPVGRANTQKASVIFTGCPGLWVYLHEIGHTLGLEHEQQRPDRSNYFNLDCNRIRDDDKGIGADCTPGACKGLGCAFEEYSNSLVYDFLGPYDTKSIMHYQLTAFAKDSSFPPLIPKPGVEVPNYPRPSLMDLVRVCEIFKDQCFGKGVCGDGVVSPANGEECDPGCEGVETATCTAGCRRKVCGNGRIEGSEECDDGPSGSATCTPTCKKIVAPACLKTCDINNAFSCDQTTSCITIEGGTAASAGKHYCACRHGFRADISKPQMRLPWYAPISQQGRVFVEPGTPCNLLCNDWTLGKDGCTEVKLESACY